MRRSRLLVTGLALLLTARLAPATWSIIIIDKRTGEIAIGSATCVTGYDLRNLASVVRVGIGAAAAQSYVDFSAQNRMLIFAELGKGTTPQQILAMLAQQDTGHQTRQYGIGDVLGRTVGFTGNQASAWAGHLTGGSGDLVWAIQGNLLVGEPVIKKAEEAIQNTPGDLAAKLMAAMEASRAQGGDARCTPANKSAHIGYMIVARRGDVDGPCNATTGCASGTYWMNFNVANQAYTAPDPVLQLRALYDAWRQTWVGRPDHHRSTVTLLPPSLPADGQSWTLAKIALHDWRGQPVTANATVSVTVDPTSTASVTVGSVTAVGNGVYVCQITAGTTAGKARLRVTADDGKGAVLLGPLPEIDLVGDPLWASARTMSAAQGGPLGFVLQGGGARAQRIYVVLGTASGSTPGIRVSPSLVIPINPDPVFSILLELAAGPVFPGGLGLTDGGGRGVAILLVPPGALAPILGKDLTFAWATLNPIDFASNSVVVPVR
jgi:uncharacterized Ntn-hydrolase superfamily protein